MPVELKLFCGQANTPLAQAIGRELASFTEWKRYAEGVPCVAKPFSDGEPEVDLKENVRGADVFLIQSTNQARPRPDGRPVSDPFVELLAMVNAARLASAGSITAVIPYFGYARQDRKVKPRTPITAQVVCAALEVAGVDRVLTADLHAGQIQGFFRRPFDNLEALPCLLRQARIDAQREGILEVPSDVRMLFRDIALVSPDDGGLDRCRETGKLIDATKITFVMKQRDGEGQVHTYGVRDPELVRDRVAFIIDDMIDTAGTLTHAVRAVRTAGARRVFVFATHPILSVDRKSGASAVQRLLEAAIDRAYVADTIPLRSEVADDPRVRARIHVVSTADHFAGAIHEIHEHGSVSGIFKRACGRIFSDGPTPPP